MPGVYLGGRFRPALWPTLFLIPALALLIGLGTWQLQRLAWKSAIIETIERQTAAPPAAMPARFDDPAAWSYRPVRVEGRFLHDRELFLAARTYQGQVGYHVVTPLVRADGAGTVLVNRGWIPLDRRDPATRRESQAVGPVTVEGILRLPPSRGRFQPDNDPAANQWFWTDLPAMARAAGVDDAAPLVLEAARSDEDPETLPIGGQTRLDVPNDHLQYALTWYGFAVTLLVIYVLYHRRRPIQGAPTP